MSIYKLYQGKGFCKTSFQLGMGLKNEKKQGRDERMNDYPTSAQNTQQMYDTLLAFIHHGFVSVLFQAHPYLKLSFTVTFSLLSVLFWGDSKLPSK